MGIFGNLTGWHLLVIVFLVLLLFGAPKLPGLAKSVGQSMKIFKAEIKTDKPEKTDETTPATSATTAPPVSSATTASPVTPVDPPAPAASEESAAVNPTTGTPGSQTKP